MLLQARPRSWLAFAHESPRSAEKVCGILSKRSQNAFTGGRTPNTAAASDAKLAVKGYTRGEEGDSLYRLTVLQTLITVDHLLG